MDNEAATKLYFDWLSERGHSPKLDAEGNIRFN